MEANNAFAASTPAAPARPAQQRCEEVLRVAGEMFRQSPDWVTFLREVLGVGGAARKLFPSPEELAWFEQTEEYAEIQQMLAQLRTQIVPTTSGDDKEPTRVITVRLPKTLHELLRKEAHERSTSMNKLCISKLLQMIDEELIPSDIGEPGPGDQVKIVRVDEAHAQPSAPAGQPAGVGQPHIYGR